MQNLSSSEYQNATARLDILRGKLQEMPWYSETFEEGQDIIMESSKLAWIFCQNPTLDEEDVAHEIATVHFLYKGSSYPLWVEKRLREAANLLHDAYPDLDWKTLWKLVARFAVPMVKYAAFIEVAENADAANMELEYQEFQMLDEAFAPFDKQNTTAEKISSWADVTNSP